MRKVKFESVLGDGQTYRFTEPTMADVRQFHQFAKAYQDSSQTMTKSQEAEAFGIALLLRSLKPSHPSLTEDQLSGLIGLDEMLELIKKLLTAESPMNRFMN